MLWEEFNRVLKDVKRDAMLLLSEGDDDDDDGRSAGTRWLRVTAQSDLGLVLERASLKLVERPATSADDEQLPVAFPVEVAADEEPAPPTRGERRARKERRAKGGRASGAAPIDDGGRRDSHARFDDEGDEEEAGGASRAPPHAAPARFVDDDESDEEPPAYDEQPTRVETREGAAEADLIGSDDVPPAPRGGDGEQD